MLEQEVMEVRNKVESHGAGRMKVENQWGSIDLFDPTVETMRKPNNVKEKFEERKNDPLRTWLILSRVRNIN